MSKVSQSKLESAISRVGARDVFTLFVFLWGAAALFRVLGPSGAAVGIFVYPTVLGLTQILLAIGSLWLLIRPGDSLPLILVAIIGPIVAWQEAPILGNHWLLVTFVDIAILLSALIALRDGRINRKRLAEIFLPIARWCLVLFYPFAAFAKLNSAFFDTTVSCSTYYLDETARSLGFSAPPTVGMGGMVQALPALTVITEFSIPILLSCRRTRIAGVGLGLAFHSLIALDRIHLFIDFSSVLAAMFILFLPARFATCTLRFLKGRGRQLLIFWISIAGLILVAQWIGRGGLAFFVFSEGRLFIWYVFDLAILLGVAFWLVRHRWQTLERPFAFGGKGSVWLAMVPALLVLNGLLPYFELRTAYVYTMYSNLSMVAGKSNHFIVRSSFPLSSRQTDLVKLVASSDPGLSAYATENYLLPWDSFRTYLAKHPQEAVIYERGGKRYLVDRASDYPELITPPSLLTQKFFALRAVDGSDKARCQDVFLPAL